MRIAITTMMWRRPEVFAVWATSIQRLMDDFPGTHFDVVVAGSEKAASRKLCESFGFHYIEVPNTPLGRKANARLKECKKFNPDFVYLCGSDDIISTETFRKYITYASNGWEEITILNLYYFNVINEEFAFSRGYIGQRKGEPIAPFRMISRRLCDSMGWTGWSEKEKLYLDGHILKKLAATPHRRMCIDLKKNNDFALDIKSEVNMTPFTWRPNFQKADIKIMQNSLPDKEFKMILALCDKDNRNMKYNGVNYLR